MGGMSTRNEIKARLGILAEPKVAMTRPNAKAKFDSLAKFKAKVVQLVTMLGFKPDEITGNSEMVHVLFMDKPGQADRLAIALRRNLAQVGVPASAITTHEHRYADDDTTYGGVWVDVRALANAKSRASRPGAKAKMDKNADYVEYANLRETLSKLENRLRRAPVEQRARLQRELDAGIKRYRELADRLRSSRPGAKAKMDRRIEVDRWTSPKGTMYTAGIHQHGGGTFQPFIVARYSDGGEQLMSGNAPSFKSEAGARKWLAKELQHRKVTASRPGAKAKMGKDLRELNTYLSSLIRQRDMLVSDDRRAKGKDLRVANHLNRIRQEIDAVLMDIARAEKATASRPGAKATHAAADKPGRKVMAESDPAVSAKIRKLMAEGKPQKQAVAIALDMKRRGEI
jgi:ribosomal protein S18